VRNIPATNTLTLCYGKKAGRAPIAHDVRVWQFREREVLKQLIAEKEKSCRKYWLQDSFGNYGAHLASDPDTGYGTH